MKPNVSALSTDLYELAMMQGYLHARMEDRAVFEFFVRRFPSRRNFLVAAGLEQVLEYLQRISYQNADLEFLDSTRLFSGRFLEYLRQFRFRGDVDAMPEGTIFFPNEPVLRITAPISEAQFVEPQIINLLQFQILIASKAVRCVFASPGKSLVDFGLRRAHSPEAGLFGARACYIAGFAATSNVLAGAKFGIPISGTMAHSFIQACDSEEEAFERFARANPQNVVFLLDTYDTEAAARKVVRLAGKLRDEGIPIKGVRLDSGDLADHARKVRRILDKGGLKHVTIFASGNLDEDSLAQLTKARAPIDGFGVGSRVLTSADSSYLDCAYKLQEYAGRPRCKLSESKATWPGAHQVYRENKRTGQFTSDTIALTSETLAGRPLLLPVMRNGKLLGPHPTLSEIRKTVVVQLKSLPPKLRFLEPTQPFPVIISERLQQLATTFGVCVR